MATSTIQNSAIYIHTKGQQYMHMSGALEVLHNELSNLDFDVVALRETRLESGIQKFDNFAIFNSGLESKNHECGCGFNVSGEF
jgi:hypothetical protein